MAECVGDADTLVTEDVERALAALEGADLFTLYALRWRMLNDPKYVPYLDEWAFTMTPELAQQIKDFVQRGGGMLAMHTASICFDTWPGFSAVLGGHWEWGTTFHPELSEIEVEPLGDHPIVADVEAFSVVDEVYHDLAIEPASEPLLRARVTRGPEDQPGAWHTVAWAHSPGDGQVVYSALGHSTDSLAAPMHSKFLRNSIAWLGKL